MTIDIRKFEQLKRQNADAKAEKARAEGILDDRLKRLREEFGCKDLKSAERQLERTIIEEKDLEKEYNAALAKFEKDSNEKL